MLLIAFFSCGSHAFEFAAMRRKLEAAKELLGCNKHEGAHCVRTDY